MRADCPLRSLRPPPSPWLQCHSPHSSCPLGPWTPVCPGKDKLKGIVRPSPSSPEQKDRRGKAGRRLREYSD